jgi:uncharacterized protein YjcR
MRHREVQMSNDTSDDMVLGIDSITVTIGRNWVKREGWRIERLVLSHEGEYTQKSEKKKFPFV